MRIIGILLLAIFFVSCGNNAEETYVEERNYSIPAPQYIVVRESNSGERHYQFFDGSMTENQVIRDVESDNSTSGWTRIGNSQLIDQGRRSNGAVRFVQEGKDYEFVQTRRGAFGANGAAIDNCYVPTHIYYGSFTYGHCYPQNFGYNGYRYLPSYLWQNTYFYYRPFYSWNNWNNWGNNWNNWNYYFYRWGF